MEKIFFLFILGGQFNIELSLPRLYEKMRHHFAILHNQMTQPATFFFLF